MDPPTGHGSGPCDTTGFENQRIIEVPRPFGDTHFGACAHNTPCTARANFVGGGDAIDSSPIILPSGIEERIGVGGAKIFS